VMAFRSGRGDSMRVLAWTLVAAWVVFGPALVAAREFKVGNLLIDHPWARPTPPVVKVGAAYMTITNNGTAEDRLTAGMTPLAERVEIHRTETTEGISRMVPQPDGIIIPPRATVAIEPGGYHLMLVGLTGPLQLDAKVPLTLTFADAGTVEVELAIQRRPTEPAPADHSGH
jgi:copper(I)-binding protein